MNLKTAVSRVMRRDTDESAAPDALTLIHRDHEEVNALFETALGDGTPAAQRRSAVAQICEALTLHAKMEEALFYPALRRAGGAKEKDSVLEAGEEHGVVKDLIAKIRRVQGRDETLKAKLTVLKEMVQHHVEEEESEMFDEARRVLGDEQLQALGEEMQRFKERGGTRGGGRKASGRKTTARKAPARKAEPARTAASSRKVPSRKAAGRGGRSR